MLGKEDEGVDGLSMRWKRCLEIYWEISKFLAEQKS